MFHVKVPQGIRVHQVKEGEEGPLCDTSGGMK